MKREKEKEKEKRGGYERTILDDAQVALFRLYYCFEIVESVG